MDGVTRRVRLVFMGRRLKASGGLGWLFREEESEEMHFYSRALLPGLVVGTVIEVSMTEDDGVLGSERLVVGSVSGDEVLGWAAKEASEVTLDARQALSRKVQRGVEQPLADALATLRTAYGAVSGVGRRAAFIDWVNASIQGG